MVKKATGKLRDRNGKPKRITVKSIANAIGKRALLEQHLQKMPKTKAFINEVWKSNQEFRLRRIQYVIHEMEESGQIVRAWKVLRKAGIKKKYIDEIIELIEMHI